MHDEKLGTTEWHACTADDCLAQLQSAPQGIDDAEAARRVAQYGRNELPPPPRRHPLLRFLAQFNNALILFLIGAAVVAATLDHLIDAAVILGVVLINAIIGFVQEGRAEQALSALRAMLAPSARVLRAGQRREIAVAELVPGDIVLLEAGDRVPADLRLLRARGLLIDEAILTGESVAAEKNESTVARDAALGDRSGMAFSGTLVAAGQAQGVAVATGLHTEIGHISKLLGNVETLTTPLLKQMNQFGRRFALFALIGAALLLLFAVTMRDYSWVDALMVVVALAVGVIPEGLPAVITITLAIGVQRMAARHAIVRQLPAVETLGATTVICTDKTGTLTRNEMTVRRIVTRAGEIDISGAGYAPEGSLTPAADKMALQLIRSAALCNDAQLKQRGDEWLVDGDPMEGALLTLAQKANIDLDALRAQLPRRDEIPFDAQHRFMATLHAIVHNSGHTSGDAAILLVKGAPEALLAMSRVQLSGDGSEQPLDLNFWETAIAQAAAQGERVLGFALRRFTALPERLNFADAAELQFIGIAGFIDPPRPEAIDAVAQCRSAGIAVKMITGDHATTAAAIATQLGLTDHPEVITGADLDAISDADLPQRVERASVFARTSPAHKLRVVRALQSRGEVVAMTGDGVNDAPSLKQADVGVAMGHKGTEAAKEAARVVLTDDNFASIVAAVHEGRTVYDNIRKVVAWTLPTNGGEALCIITALALGMTLPMTAVQILWINMVTAITLGLALAFEPPEAGVMQRPPRSPKASLISGLMLWRIVLVSLLFTAGAFGIYGWAIQRGLDVATARTMVVNTLCVMEIFYLFNVRYLHGTSFSLRGLLGTPAVLWAVGIVTAAQLLFTYTPWLQKLFDTRAVPLIDGLLIVAMGVAMMAILEFEKLLLRRLRLFERS